MHSILEKGKLNVRTIIASIEKHKHTILTMQRVIPISARSSSFYDTTISNIKGALALLESGMQHFTGR